MTPDEWQAALTSIRGMLGRHFRPNHGYVAGRHDIASARSAPAVARATTGIAQGGCYE